MSRGSATTRTSASGPSRSSGDTEAQVLGASVRIRGRVHGDGALRVEGTIDGDVKVSGSVELAEGGVISGDVVASSVTVEGTLSGDVHADGAITIRSGARVSGDLRGAEVSLDEGAAFVGRIEADFELPQDLLDGSFVGAPAPAGKKGRPHDGASRGR
jgi:cytoskeletal protein CcmA (bactofilin family)